jgi:hypothetical protein
MVTHISRRSARVSNLDAGRGPFAGFVVGREDGAVDGGLHVHQEAFKTESSRLMRRWSYCSLGKEPERKEAFARLKSPSASSAASL